MKDRDFHAFDADGRPTVIIVDWDGIDYRDYPDFCDGFIATAHWASDGEELTEEELEKFTDQNPDFVFDAKFNHAIGA